jgi:hypothetical protein
MFGFKQSTYNNNKGFLKVCQVHRPVTYAIIDATSASTHFLFKSLFLLSVYTVSIYRLRLFNLVLMMEATHWVIVWIPSSLRTQIF